MDMLIATCYLEIGSSLGREIYPKEALRASVSTSLSILSITPFKFVDSFFLTLVFTINQLYTYQTLVILQLTQSSE